MNAVVEANKLDLFEIVRAFKFLIGNETLEESTRVVRTKNPGKQVDYGLDEFRDELRRCLADMRHNWFQVRTVKRDRELYLKDLIGKKFVFDFNNLPKKVACSTTTLPTANLIAVDAPRSIQTSTNVVVFNKEEAKKTLNDDLSNLPTDKDLLNKYLMERLQLASAEMIRLKERLFIAQKMHESQSDKDYLLEVEAKKTELTMKNTALTINSMLDDQTIGGRRTIRAILHTGNSTTTNNVTPAALSNETNEMVMMTSSSTISSMLHDYDKSSTSLSPTRNDANKKSQEESKRLVKKPLNPFKMCRRKLYAQVSQRHKLRLRNVVKDVFSKSCDFLKSMGLRLDEVVIKTMDEDEVAGDEMNAGDDDLDEEFKLTITSSMDPQQLRKKTSVYNLLYYKDKHSISDRAYGELRTKCFLDIPSAFLIKKRRAEIDKMYDLYSNPMGVFVSLEHKLRNRLEYFFMKKYKTDSEFDDETFKDDIIHIKLSADGTNIGRTLKLLNFTFTIMNEGSRAKTASGNYTLGIYEIECENYGSLTECFKELIQEIEQLKELTIGNKKLKIVYYLAADWKMLSIVEGIMGANSKYPCVWCKCAKEEFANYEHDWSITDPEQGARTHEEMAAILNSKNKNILKYGHEKMPVFKDIIPISRYIIDMLHLFLRISDTLFNLLVKDCSLADDFNMEDISKFDVAKYKHMNSLQHFLNEKCSVRFTFLWVAETKKLTWRDLVGKEKVRMFENFNLAEIMPDHKKFESVSKIWNEFYSILKEVKQCTIEPFNLKVRASEWIKLYLTVYNRATVTPYMHAFVNHLHEFVHLYKDVNAFNCQGLEKLNDISTAQYFKATNKRDTALHQMLKKRNRLEYLNSFTHDDDDEDN